MKSRRTIFSLLLALGFVTTSAGAQQIVESLSNAEANALQTALDEVAQGGTGTEASTSSVFDDASSDW